MAERRKQWGVPEKPHAYKLIDEDIRGGTLKNLLLLCGREQFFVEWAVGCIVKKYVNPAAKALDFVKLEGESTSVDEILLACETFSMFSEKRVVWVRDFAPLGSARAKGYGEAEEKRLLEFFKEMPESCILILSAEKVDGRKKIVKDLSSIGHMYQFDTLDDATLKVFIRGRFKRAGKHIEEPMVRAIIEKSGYYNKDSEYDLFALENDLKKIVAHSSGQEILLSDVKASVEGDAQSNVFEMVEAASRGRKEEAYWIFANFMEGKDDALAYLPLSLLATQFELVLSVKEMSAERMNPAQMKKILGVHEFRIKKAMELRDRYSVQDLHRILMSIYSVDKNVKSGNLPIKLALEMLIAQL